MLITLPLIAFVALFFVFLGRQDASLPRRPGLTEAFIRAAAAWGFVAVAILEGLSAIRQVVPAWVGLGWFLATAGILAWGGGSLTTGVGRLSGRIREVRDSGLQERVLAAGAVAMGGLILLVGWLAPANNVDSLLYHMSRLVHWAQNQHLNHYATAYPHQLYMQPWAESVILHLRLLWGDDRPAALVQAVSLMASAGIAAALAGKLSGLPGSRLTAGLFVLSVPLAILEASTAQNDLVVTFWLMALAYTVVAGRSGPWGFGELATVGLILGLGTLTKLTFVVYAFPFVVWLLWTTLGPGRPAFRPARLLLLAGVALLPNLPHWARNMETFGTPLGPVEFAVGSRGIALGGQGPISVAAVFRTQARMLARNFTTPLDSVNRWIGAAEAEATAVFGEPYRDEMITALWNHEDTAGNPIHLLAAVASLLPLAYTRRSSSRPGLAPYLAATSTGYLMMPLIIVNGSDLDGLRFQLPFFAAWAPLWGTAIASLGNPIARRLSQVALFLLALPYLLFNNTRPLIGRQPWVTRTPSVLSASPSTIAFAMFAGNQDEFTAVAQAVAQSDCHNLGLSIDSHDPEYLFWWLLGAPQSRIRLEHVTPDPELTGLVDPAFEPCAVVCTICGEEGPFRGKPLRLAFGRTRLYLDSSLDGAP
jgi:hypothetical protein